VASYQQTKKMSKLTIINASLMAGPPENGFTKAMDEVFDCTHLNCGDKNFDEKLIGHVYQLEPDLVFIQTQTEGVLKTSTVRLLKDKVFMMQFSGDIRVPSPPEWYIDLAKAGVHLSTFTNMKDVKGTIEKGFKAEWLEIGFDPLKYRKWEDPLPAPKIVAHFNDYGESYFPLSGYRRKIVEQMQFFFGDDFGVYGNFKGAKGNFNSDQAMESRNYAGAKIAINCSHFFCEQYSSDRMLRILGSGTFCMSHHFPGIELMYKVGTHLDTFNSIDSLVMKCSQWLADDAKREQVAAAGQKHALENYTFLHMAKNIEALYLKHKNG
jgi:hypothetical protein